MKFHNKAYLSIGNLYDTTYKIYLIFKAEIEKLKPLLLYFLLYLSSIIKAYYVK